MAKRSFSPELLESLRSMVVTKALDALGLHWKRDPDFQPVKDAATIRLHVAVGGQVFELLVTGAKFFDTRADKGGGGAIDLAMHLLRLDFVAAVKRLSSSRVWGLGSNGTKNQRKPYQRFSVSSSQAPISTKQLRMSASWLISVSRSCTLLSSSSSLRYGMVNS